ncbi:VC0807 family protein [Pseudobacillus wudalianchiensis]|uniref:Intracellular septation protein A n=1 Tax=Pseudobacillus wudalianchiensis TaxID=1743143 RepID=A0A1B9B6X7_9BACI|nr:VC0807 family protein [Bacillus wudalianchiensis]OCA91855.1 hypothetical protein A8F95_19170 [Bacillus wudalianchiensis]
MKNYVVLFDLICYVAIPLLIWNFGRDLLGDYYAMLISSVPGILYSIYRFILIKTVNLFGIFMLGNLIVGTLIDVLAGSAMQLLWNNVFYSYTIALLFIISVLVNRPLFLFFAIDFTELQGSGRHEMKKSFYQKKVLRAFKWITLLFAFRDVLLASVKIWLIKEYGVDAFDKGIVLRQVLSWGITAVSVIGFIYISKLLQTNEEEPIRPPV